MKTILPYLKLMRLDRPIGIWLLLFPCLWSLMLSDFEHYNVKLIVIFTIGSVVMRSAGCVINDLVDVKFDQQVERTKIRPLAANELNQKQALICLAVLLNVALALLPFLSKLAVKYSFFALIPVIIYPFMKRITHWPQAFLGITFNYGVIIAWISVNDKLSLAALSLYFACVAWTLAYDTIYALQDVRDDRKIGLKSTAILFEDDAQRWIKIFYNGFLGLLFIAVKLCNITTLFYLVFIPLIFIINWLTNNLDINEPANCHKLFKANIWIGILITTALIIAKTYHVSFNY